jgi:predicted dehydrogenase
VKQVRFGVVGAGQAAHYCIEEIIRHPDATVVAAHDLNTERLEALCSSFSIKRGYADIDALLEDNSVDAVYIAVPNKYHALLAKQALEAGKHVILEKPFAMNLAEAEDVAKAVESSGRAFMLGMNYRFIEDHQKIRTCVNNGALGEIYHVKSVWFRRSGIPKLGTWFGEKAMAGQGCLYDIGVHMLDLCLYTIGNFEPVSVSGVTYTKFGNRGLGECDWGYSDREDTIFDTDDFASAFIRLANGTTVSLDVAWACHQENSQLYNVTLYGTEGGATLIPAKIFRNDPLRDDYDVIDKVKADIEFTHCSRFHNFINHILGKEDLCVAMKEALVVQNILDAIDESSTTGREVCLKV